MIRRATTFGIVMIDSLACRLRINSVLRPGRGEFTLIGLLADYDPEPVVAASVSACYHAQQLCSKPFLDLSSYNVLVSITIPASPESPIYGPSYGLCLAANLICLLCGLSCAPSTAFTGEVSSEGSVLPVGDAAQKRRQAASLQFDRIALPTANLDFLTWEVNQIPVRNLYELWSILDAQASIEEDVQT